MGLKMGLSWLLRSRVSLPSLHLCLAICALSANSKASFFRLEISSTECDTVAPESFTASLNVGSVSELCFSKGSSSDYFCFFGQPFPPVTVGMRLRRRPTSNFNFCFRQRRESKTRRSHFFCYSRQRRMSKTRRSRHPEWPFGPFLYVSITRPLCKTGDVFIIYNKLHDKSVSKFVVKIYRSLLGLFLLLSPEVPLISFPQPLPRAGVG